MLGQQMHGSVQKKMSNADIKMLLKQQRRLQGNWQNQVLPSVQNVTAVDQHFLPSSVPPPYYIHENPSLLRVLIQTLASFCTETTLHGFKNMMDDINALKSNGTRQQKIANLISLFIWISACVLGIGFALLLMYLVWIRYETNPTITTVETTNYPIWNVAFPAVTLCNINKVFRPAIGNISKILIENGLPPDKTEQFFTKLDKLISPEYIDYIFFKAFEILDRMNYTTERLMYELMEPCEFMLNNCSWLGIPAPCNTLFRVSKSFLGFCCSFNYRAVKTSLEVEIATDSNRIDDIRDDPVYHVSGAGSHIGLGALIRVAPNYYVSYTNSYFGVSILVHGPADYPQASVTRIVGQPGCDLTITVTPSVLTSAPTIRNIPQSKRNCYFDDEKKLRTTDKYSFQSCITECAVDTILKKCQCIPFYFPETGIPWFMKRKRQCTLRDVKCLRDFQHIFYSLQPEEKTVDEDGLNELGMDCKSCLPGCSEENYSVQTNLARRYPQDNLTSVHYNSVNLSNYLTFKIHFKDISCIKYRRDVFQTWDGLLACFGGIFGLCLGGSVISLVEFVYFITFQFYNNYFAAKIELRRKLSQSYPEMLLRPKMKMVDGVPTIKMNAGDYPIGRRHTNTIQSKQFY